MLHTSVSLTSLIRFTHLIISSLRLMTFGDNYVFFCLTSQCRVKMFNTYRSISQIDLYPMSTDSKVNALSSLRQKHTERQAAASAADLHWVYDDDREWVWHRCWSVTMYFNGMLTLPLEAQCVYTEKPLLY